MNVHSSRHPVSQVLIAAGGTGGHVFPALAVARALMARGVAVAWLGSEGGMERALVERAGIAFHAIRVSALRGKGLMRWPRTFGRLVGAYFQARDVLKQLAPDVVLGMGGYVSAPTGIAAWIAGCPLVVHEQNAIPGLTNRILSRIAHRVLEAFPASFPSGDKVVHSGNPVRAEIAAIAEPDVRLRHRCGACRVFVLGGSQGALALNEVLPKALKELYARCPLDIWHQCGAAHVASTRDAYRAVGLSVEPCAFIDDMAERYAWADVVIARAGAMTIAELAAAGVASVLVPFPYAVDDHQSANARYLAEAGAAVLLPQVELRDRLRDVLGPLLDDRGRILEMARRARALARPDATQTVVEQCLEVAGA